MNKNPDTRYFFNTKSGQFTQFSNLTVDWPFKKDIGWVEMEKEAFDELMWTRQALLNARTRLNELQNVIEGIKTLIRSQ
jgi:hypothetical protein